MATPRVLRSRVLVVGGGPVGTTLAMDLAWRGIDVIVAEQRARGEPPSVKCNHVSARTMEIFRRLGVARAVRDAGLPADYPNDVAFRTTTTGIEFARIPIPCRRDRYTATDGRIRGGRLRNRRTASTRSSWSRCWWNTPPPCRACASCTARACWGSRSRRMGCARKRKIWTAANGG